MPKVGKQKAHLCAWKACEKQQKSDPAEPVPDQLNLAPILLSSSNPWPSTSGGVPEAEETEGSSPTDSDTDPEDALLKDPDGIIKEFQQIAHPRDDFPSLTYLAARISPACVSSLQNYWHGATIQKVEIGLLQQYKRSSGLSLRQRENASHYQQWGPEQARLYVQENSFKKDAPNTTAWWFCFRVSDELLPNQEPLIRCQLR